MPVISHLISIQANSRNLRVGWWESFRDCYLVLFEWSQSVSECNLVVKRTNPIHRPTSALQHRTRADWDTGSWG